MAETLKEFVERLTKEQKLTLLEILQEYVNKTNRNTEGKTGFPQFPQSY